MIEWDILFGLLLTLNSPLTFYHIKTKVSNNFNEKIINTSINIKMNKFGNFKLQNIFIFSNRIFCKF